MNVPWDRRITPAESRRRARALARASKEQVPLWHGDTPEAKRRRRERVKDDPDEWNRTYLPHYFDAPAAEVHTEWRKLEAEGQRRHMPVALAAPREHGKSVNITFADTLRNVLEGTKNFQVIIADTADQSTKVTHFIKRELETNPRIIRDYGPQKSVNQWADHDFVTQDGRAVLALGRGQDIRGRRHYEYRPDRIVLDDYDDSRLARNPTLAQEAFQEIKTSYIPALDNRVGVLMVVGNLYSFNAVLNLCIEDPEQSFLTRVDMALTDPVWDEKRRLFTSGTPLWPEMFTLGLTTATMKGLSSIRRNVGERAWEAEYQNNPSAALLTFRPEWFLRYDPYEHPSRGYPLQYYCAIDPSIKHHTAADYKAQIVCAPYENLILCRYAWIRRCSIGEMLETTFALHQRFNFVQVGLEEEGQQLLFRKEYVDLGQDKNTYLPLVPILHKGWSKDSMARIPGLSIRMEAGGILFAQGDDVGDMDLLIQQFKGFDSKVVAKDGPDATQMCIGLIEPALSGTGQVIPVGTYRNQDARVERSSKRGFASRRGLY